MTVLSTLADRHHLLSCVVVVDVFRSSNTILALLAAGAAGVVTVAEEELARALKKRHPDWLLAGERKGVRLRGFDADNSPTHAPPRARGRTVVLTTSGGTRCIEACGPRREVIIGSFGNADALMRYLWAEPRRSVAFWAVGLAGDEPAEEDELCAHYLDDLYNQRQADFEKVRRKAEATTAAQRLREMDLDEDIWDCLTLNHRSIVPVRMLRQGLAVFQPAKE